MATNTGLSFVSVGDEQRRSAELSTSLSDSTTPFYDGVRFHLVFRPESDEHTVEGTLPIDEWAIAHDYRRAAHNGVEDKDGNKNPVLMTSIGAMFVSMLTKSKVDVDGEVHEPAGEVNKLIVSILRQMHGQKDYLIWRAIEQALLDVELTVRAEPYNASGYEGRVTPKTLPHIEFVNKEDVEKRRAELEKLKQERDAAAAPNGEADAK